MRSHLGKEVKISRLYLCKYIYNCLDFVGCNMQCILHLSQHFLYPRATSHSFSLTLFIYQWYFVTKIVLTYCEKKKCSSDPEKLLKFVAEGREFAKILRSLEQFVRTVKGQNNFW